MLTILAFTASSTALATPTAPGALTAVSASSTQINLSWTAATDSGGTITAYIIQRCLGSSCTNFAQVGSVASGTTYSDSGLTPASAYHYQVYATDATSSGPFSNVASATTLVTSISSGITYGYDALGRLVQANVTALSLVENYTYDSAGNLTSVTSSPTTMLAVANLSSPQGPVGGTVTIFGSGFSTTPASNTVQFNGKAATVVSASTTQLVVTVPTGATTGSVTVKTGTTTVSSPGSYAITTKTGAPTITLAPTIAAPGTTITIQGTGFQSTASYNKVQINQTWATVISATSTSLTVLVPNITQPNPNVNGYNVGAGFISITTPFGSVTSAAPLIISNQSYTVVATTSVNGAPVNLATTSPPLYAIVTFNGTQGQALAIGINNVLPANAATSATVLAPNGNYLTGLYVTGNGGGQLPVLPMSGTYTVLISGFMNNLALSVVGPATGSLTLNGTPTNVAWTLPGQAASFTFSGTKNSNATLSLTNVILSAGAAAFTVFNPDGTVLNTSQLTTSGLALSPQLPQSGTYTVLVVPRGSSTGSFTLALTSAQSATLVANQPPYSLTLTNQTPSTLYFNGAQGQYLSLGTSETAGTISTVMVTMLDADGVQLTNSPVSLCSACRGQVLNFGPLKVSGVYSIVVQQMFSSVTGTISLALATPLGGTTSLGATSNPSVSLLGQGIAQTFSGNAGQYLSAAFTSAWMGTSGTISIVGADGVSIGSQTFSGDCGGYQCNSFGALSVGPLPSTGTYTVLIQQTNGGWGASTGALSLTLEPIAQGTMTIGTPTSVPVLLGQGFEESFAGTSGQYLSIALQASSSGATVTSGTLSVLDPNGVLIGTAPFSGSCATACSGSGVINVGPLSITGTYSVLLQQTNNANPPAAGSITISPEAVIAGALTNGSTSNVPVAAGQGFSETFSGTTGQYLSVSVASQGSTAVTAGTITVLSSSGAVLLSVPYTGSCVSGTCSGAGNINLGPLPTTGTYTVVFQQTGGAGGPAAATLTVTPELPVTGALTLGTPATVSVVKAQAIQKTFSGTAGQYDTVTVSETTSLIQGATFSVIAPDGTGLQSGVLTPACTATCTGTTTINVGPLPSTGTYTLLVQQAAEAYGFGTGSLTVTVTNNSVGPGTTQNLSTTVPGQAAQFTFNAAASQSFNLNFANIAFVPSSVTTYSVKITAPDGTQAYYNVCYSASCELFLTGITQTGTYTVAVTPGGSATMTGTATLSASVVGTLVLGTALPLNLAIGQGAALSFVATQGQTVALQIGSLTSSPANAYYSFNVANSSGQTVASTYTYVGPTLNLPNLPAGTYTLTIVPGNPPASSTMQVTLAAGVTDPLPLTGAGVNISTSTPGEAANVTFAGSYGQSVSLAITNLAFSPSSVTFASVRQPVSNLLVNWYGTCSVPGCEVHMPFLPGNANYSATVTPGGAATMNFTANITPDVNANLSWGTPLNLTLSELGQSAMVTFSVAPGAQQNPSITVSGITTNPTSAQYYMTIYDVDRGYASHGGTTLSNGGTAVSNYTDLTPGTYLLIITPSVPAVGSMQITVAPSTTVVLPTSGTTTNVSTTVPGQYSHLSFSASAGQNLSLALSNCALSPTTTTSLTFVVYNPNGTGIGSAACYAGTPGGVINLPNLTQTGTYTVQVYPSGLATMTFGATLSQNATGALTLNTPKNETLSSPGQAAKLSFTATAGQTVALTIGSVVTTPAGNSLTATVFDPSGASINYTFVSATSPAIFNLNNLAAGTYSVLITPNYATTQTLTVTLNSGDTGVLPTNGTTSNFSTTIAGEGVYLSFPATAGQSLSFVLSNLVMTPSSGYTNMYLYPPTGSYLYYFNCIPPSQTFCGQGFPVLPQSGTYTIQIIPSGQNTMSFSTVLFQDVSGTLVSTSASNVSLPIAGENAALSFTAPGGQTATINATTIATTPVNTAVGFSVYNSARALVGSSSGTTTATLTLPNLPAGGYSLIIAPSNGATASMQITGTGIQ